MTFSTLLRATLCLSLVAFTLPGYAGGVDRDETDIQHCERSIYAKAKPYIQRLRPPASGVATLRFRGKLDRQGYFSEITVESPGNHPALERDFYQILVDSMPYACMAGLGHQDDDGVAVNMRFRLSHKDAP